MLYSFGHKVHSCLIEPDAAGRWREKDAKGRLKPKYRIELPGKPILGNGKSDNQNCALPFTRGSILQAIDCNQEGYLEEALPELHARLNVAGAELSRPEMAMEDEGLGRLPSHLPSAGALLLFNSTEGMEERAALIAARDLETNPRGKLAYHIEAVGLLWRAGIAAAAARDGMTLRLGW